MLELKLENVTECTNPKLILVVESSPIKITDLLVGSVVLKLIVIELVSEVEDDVVIFGWIVSLMV